MAEEIDVEMCSYGQLSELQMVRDLDLDNGWCHGHINIYSTCRTSSVPNHVTVASRTTEIRPLEYRELECGPMPNLMAALPNTGGALCSTPQSLADAHY